MMLSAQLSDRSCAFFRCIPCLVWYLSVLFNTVNIDCCLAALPAGDLIWVLNCVLAAEDAVARLREVTGHDVTVQPMELDPSSASSIEASVAHLRETRDQKVLRRHCVASVQHVLYKLCHTGLAATGLEFSLIHALRWISEVQQRSETYAWTVRKHVLMLVSGGRAGEQRGLHGGRLGRGHMEGDHGR